jgi:membrane fusion protein, multidrug efflux system
MIAMVRRHPLRSGLLVVVVVAGLLAYGVHWWRVGRFLESTDDAYVGGDVTVISTRVSGYIETVAVTDNQRVRAGELLVRIDDRDYAAALARARASVAAQKATLANLAATRRLQLTVIAQAQAGVRAAQAEIERAALDRTRYRELSANAAASVQTYQKADAAYKVAAAGAERARASVEAAQREIDVIDTRTAQTQAALQGAEAEARVAELNLGYTELRAPIDGVVGNRSARKGAFAAAGTPLVSVVPAEALWVDANFKESQLRNIHPGDAVSIEVDALHAPALHGRVASLAPATGAQFSLIPPENATGNFTKIVQRIPVRILLQADSNSFGRIRPGLSVTATVDGRPASQPATLGEQAARVARSEADRPESQRTTR